MSKRVRLEDLAKAAGVSIATVSRALNDHPAVNAQTKQRIWELARSQGYNVRTQSPLAQSDAASVISITIPKPQGRDGWRLDPFFQELLGGIGEAARSMQCDYIVSHQDPKSFEDLSRLMDASPALGTIFLGQSFLHDRLNRLVGHPKPFIVWGGQLPNQDYCAVGSDNPKGGERATSHLARLGRKRIAFFGDTHAPEINQRYQGYLRSLERHGLTPDPDLVFPAHFEIESAASSMNALLSRGTKFDGVVCSSDLIAIGVIRALQKRGVNVPQDVSVVGYDDIQLARYIHPPLTTIGQDLTLAGRLMVMKLLNASAPGDMQPERLPTELIQRESCGA